MIEPSLFFAIKNGIDLQKNSVDFELQKKFLDELEMIVTIFYNLLSKKGYYHFWIVTTDSK